MNLFVKSVAWKEYYFAFACRIAQGKPSPSFVLHQTLARFLVAYALGEVKETRKNEVQCIFYTSALETAYSRHPGS